MERGANKEAVENEGRPPEDGSCSYDRPLGKNALVTARKLQSKPTPGWPGFCHLARWRGADEEDVENEGRPPEDGSLPHSDTLVCSYDKPLGKNVLVTAR
jgi:hypothetical protein